MRDSKKYIKNELKMEDLELNHQEIAAIIGLDNYIELCWNFCGSGIYLPSEKWLIQQIAKRKVPENRHLVNSKAVSIQQLAKTYNISQSSVYNYLKGEE